MALLSAFRKFLEGSLMIIALTWGLPLQAETQGSWFHRFKPTPTSTIRSRENAQNTNARSIQTAPLQEIDPELVLPPIVSNINKFSVSKKCEQDLVAPSVDLKFEKFCLEIDADPKSKWVPPDNALLRIEAQITPNTQIWGVEEIGQHLIASAYRWDFNTFYDPVSACMRVGNDNGAYVHFAVPKHDIKQGLFAKA
jgi:hypothetical protein